MKQILGALTRVLVPSLSVIITNVPAFLFGYLAFLSAEHQHYVLSGFLIVLAFCTIHTLTSKEK